ncbi:acyl-CoA thioesterase [Actinospongicola halichondriae]|uniref:acyl-CoA thioesterase n=1 Tax=Actinospongicola halichondriae TaxID=3236844 RepID=UPI003D47BC1B
MGPEPWPGLQRDPDGSFVLVVDESLVRGDGRLFGGAGAAASVVAVEAATDGRLVWLTVQFISSAEVGDQINLRVDPLASGRRTNQVRLTALAGDQVVLSAVGATVRSGSPSRATTVGAAMPLVARPEEGRPWKPRFRLGSRSSNLGPFASADFREAHGPGGRVGVWARMRHAAPSAATAAYLADVLPGVIIDGAGRVVAGSSLDNTIRCGIALGTEWVLLEPDPPLIEGGYLHCSARLWSSSGALFALVQQTAALHAPSERRTSGPTGRRIEQSAGLLSGELVWGSDVSPR